MSVRVACFAWGSSPRAAPQQHAEPTGPVMALLRLAGGTSGCLAGRSQSHLLPLPFCRLFITPPATPGKITGQEVVLLLARESCLLTQQTCKGLFRARLTAPQQRSCVRVRLSLTETLFFSFAPTLCKYSSVLETCFENLYFSASVVLR